jgi:hypothetical protein
MDSFSTKLRAFKDEDMWDNQDYIQSIVKMSNFANEKFRYYQSIWIEYDDLAFLVALVVGVWTLLFNVSTNFTNVAAKGGERQQLIEVGGAGLVVGIYAAQLLGLDMYLAVALICVVSMAQAYESNLKVKPLLYPGMIFTSLLLFCLY